MSLIHATPDYDTVEDLLVTALEGGSNYWYWLPDVSMVPKVVDRPNGDCLSIRIAKAVWDGAEVPIVDKEDRFALGSITKDGVLAALDRMIATNYKTCAGRIIAEDYDADDADAWFQFAVMGKAVYG
jgi:hypothetical protein